MGKQIECPGKHAAKNDEQKDGDVIGGFDLVEFSLGERVSDGFVVGGFIDDALEGLRHGAGVCAHMIHVQPFKPNLGRPFEHDEGSHRQAHRVKCTYHTSELKLHFAETIFNLAKDSIFVGDIFCDEGDAEAQVGTGVIPWHG